MSNPQDLPNAELPTVMVDTRKIADSGIGTYIRNILPRVMRRLPDIGFLLLGRSEVIAPIVAQISTCRIVECDVRPLSAREQVQLPRYIPNNVDLFWAPHFNIPLAYRGKLLVTVHDILPMAVPKLSGGLRHNLYVRAMMAAIRSRRADMISVSEFTASELNRLASVPRERISVIHEAADDCWSAVLPTTPPRSKPYLLFVGLVKPHKNLIGLLKGFELLRDKWPHDLVIVGDRERIVTRDEESARFAEQFGNRVVFTGRVSEPLLEQYVAHADALVVPSLYEGFGLPAIEAMACGCPVIASNAASLPEVCGDAAITFNPHDASDLAAAVVRCIGCPEQRSSMIVRGRQQAARFSWEKAADETASLIRRIVVSRDAAKLPS
jgi:glycosyltransferase involved in cell wall biosynthesis